MRWWAFILSYPWCLIPLRWKDGDLKEIADKVWTLKAKILTLKDEIWALKVLKAFS